MISFGQILILFFIALLLFGDLRKIFNRVLLLFANIKTFFHKNSQLKEKDEKKD